MKRKLIFEDQSYLSELNRQLVDYLPYLENVKKAFEQLELESFSQKIYLELLNNKTTDIRNRYNEKIESEINKAGIKNSTMRENMKAGSEQQISNLSNALSELFQFDPNRFSSDNRKPLSLNQITYKNEEFIFTKDNEENLLEKGGRLYIENEKQAELNESLLCFVDQLNKINQVVIEKGLYKEDANEKLSKIENLLIYKDGKFVVDPHKLIWLSNKIEKEERARKEYFKFQERKNAKYLRDRL